MNNRKIHVFPESDHRVVTESLPNCGDLAYVAFLANDTENRVLRGYGNSRWRAISDLAEIIRNQND